MTSFWEFASLLLVAAIAGCINAVAGGGTLLTFPTLLFFQTPPIVANATSTLALTLGTAGSVYGFRAQFARVRPWILRFAPVSALGGLIGSLLLTRTSNATFAKLVPFLILYATLLFLSQGLFRKIAGARERGAAPPKVTVWGAILFQFAVATYGGYFGAGIGILMLASLGFIGLEDIHQMNAVKNVLSSLINVVASVIFIATGLIDWPKVAVMTIGAVTGYYVGAHYSQRIPQPRVRQVITAIGFILSGLTFYQKFLR